MRRTAALDIADHIIIYYQCGEQLGRVMLDFADYIQQETLSRELVNGYPSDGDAHAEEHNISGDKLSLAIKKVQDV